MRHTTIYSLVPGISPNGPGKKVPVVKIFWLRSIDPFSVSGYIHPHFTKSPAKYPCLTETKGPKSWRTRRVWRVVLSAY